MAEIAPRGSTEVRLAGGAEYAIEQTIVTPGAAVAAAGARTLQMRFESGERYGWELATVMTGAEEKSGTGGATTALQP